YRPLEGHEFTRLLSLHPSPDRDAPLRCHIVHVNAQEVHQYPYKAISYAWGPPIFTASLFCFPARRELPITPTLESALRGFRLPSDIRTLWADAVCINQQDLDEKSVQVRRMSEIYSNAKYVRIWLGDTADDSDEAFRVIRLCEPGLIWLSEKCTKENPRDIKFADLGIDEHPFEGKHPNEITQAVKRHITKRGESALRRLFSRPWFGRRWVIQEAGLAQKGEIHCGSASLS
ncbi:heterokaryon incompatibility protein-domain-containing protein, partial [Echria macrotheca]